MDAAATPSRPSSLIPLVEEAARAIEQRVIAWRRDIHEHPELGNREVRTAGLVAAHLKKLGLDEVRTGVAYTGVVGVLRGGKPGPVVALRADMDGLPVTEEVDLPFKSKVRTQWQGEEVGVMHACGHDCHVAILMGVAEILAGLREHLPGTVKFIFQPAEEMPPPGEEGGAKLMIQEGALENPTPKAIFGLHVSSRLNAGTIGWREGPVMASSDPLEIEVQGKQTHGAAPWLGVDPIMTSAQIVMGLHTLVSRTIDITREPAVVTIGAIKGGNRGNIIPDSVRMQGTIRTFDEGMRADLHERITNLADAVARGNRAECRVCINKGYDVTHNDPVLTSRIVPTLERVAGASNVKRIDKVTGAEDFSFFQKLVPGVFFFVGSTRPGVDPMKAYSNHSPRYEVDEDALLLGLRALTAVAVDYLESS